MIHLSGSRMYNHMLPVYCSEIMNTVSGLNCTECAGGRKLLCTSVPFDDHLHSPSNVRLAFPFFLSSCFRIFSKGSSLSLSNGSKQCQLCNTPWISGLDYFKNVCRMNTFVQEKKNFFFFW